LELLVLPLLLLLILMLAIHEHTGEKVYNPKKHAT
jgi:hypothetical protein